MPNNEGKKPINANIKGLGLIQFNPYLVLDDLVGAEESEKVAQENNKIKTYVNNIIAAMIHNPVYSLEDVENFSDETIHEMHNPEQTVHRFRSMPSTNSGACRPLIPEQIVHFLGVPGIGGRYQRET